MFGCHFTSYSHSQVNSDDVMILPHPQVSSDDVMIWDMNINQVLD